MQLLLPWLLDFRIHGLLVLSVNLNLKQQMIGWAPKLRMFQPMWRQQSSVALLKLEAGRLSFACLDGPNRLQGNSFQEAKWCTAHRCAQYEIWCCNMLLYIYIYFYIYILCVIGQKWVAFNISGIFNSQHEMDFRHDICPCISIYSIYICRNIEARSNINSHHYPVLELTSN
jgi:hypothetical protein